MKQSTRAIRVRQEDLQTMRDECVELYLAEHPEMRGFKITDKHMFAQLVKFYVESP